jgi:hypothetical protein
MSSRHIDRAVQYYSATLSPEALREQLKWSAIRDRDLNEEVARDWFAVDRESWQTVTQTHAGVMRTKKPCIKTDLRSATKLIHQVRKTRTPS